MDRENHIKTKRLIDSNPPAHLLFFIQLRVPRLGPEKGGHENEYEAQKEGSFVHAVLSEVWTFFTVLNKACLFTQLSKTIQVSFNPFQGIFSYEFTKKNIL